jgi:hypothetical protein
VCEDCVVNAGTLEPQNYQNVIDAMAQIDAIPGALFVELNTGNLPSGSAGQIAGRLVTTAVAWLGYSDGHTVVFPNLEDGTENLAVWPEDELYPAAPLETMTASASDIAVAPGIWRREFASCFKENVPIGPCAAVLNANATAVTVQAAWFTQSYGHAVALAGGDVLNGGSLALNAQAFNASNATIASASALLLVR